MSLNAIFKHDQDLWRAELLLICYYIVEWHLPNHVLRQFGRLQTVAMHHEATSQKLHKFYDLDLCVVSFTAKLISFEINL
jgi:hypothetical protein